MIAGQFSGRSPRFTLLDRWKTRFRSHGTRGSRGALIEEIHRVRVTWYSLREGDGELIPSRAQTVAKTWQRVLAVGLEAKRDLGPTHDCAAIEKLDHAGLDSCRPVVAEYSSRCDHVAAVPENDRYRRLARRIASVERVSAAATFHPRNFDRTAGADRRGV